LIFLEFLPVCFNGERLFVLISELEDIPLSAVRIPYWTYLHLLLTGL